MRRAHPLPDHPEFSVIEHPSCREFRVENWRLARDGSRKVIHNARWSWLDALLPVVIAVIWPQITNDRLSAGLCAALVILYVYFKCTTVLWESVIAIPSLGIQLETHRGLPGFPLTCSRNFIPVAFLQDFIINEGLRRWNVHYYIAAIKKQDQSVTLHVAFESILPYFAVLYEVYHGVHEVMFEHISDESPTGNREDNTA
ncbi:hypothetical protein QCA50_003226 [Cerrena zonata]|uniref:Phosphatidylinositol N-acetylglucosaminyltransferase subunit H conserved domain-containing protein n=1 Tax=Cerrena zonata TaxID=2478898 RepID=A0AAW0GUH0_9APHY